MNANSNTALFLRELSPDETIAVSGGTKSALDAAKAIDMTEYLKKVDAAIAKLKEM